MSYSLYFFIVCWCLMAIASTVMLLGAHMTAP